MPCRVFVIGPNVIFKNLFMQLLACLILSYLIPLAHASEIGLDKEPITSNYAMVSSANLLATEAGLSILKKGGSAVDAAIASQLVLGLVEPQSSGLGGGGFLMHYNARTGNVESYDGRETAPKLATGNLFQKKDGTLMSWGEAASGGLSVGVPGLIKMLELAHQKHGKLPWKDLFKSGMKLAKSGFNVSPRLAQSISTNHDLKHFPAASKYFYKDGTAIKEGSRLYNLEYAETLRIISEGGAKAFYKGQIANDIADAVRNDPTNPGKLSSSDIEDYNAYQRQPVCGQYRRYKICGMGPPSSGGITTLQILGLIERFDLSSQLPNSLKSVHLLSEASRLAFADRAMFIADSDYTNVPVKGLINRNYLAERSKLIRTGQSMGKANPGQPEGVVDSNFTTMQNHSNGNSTTHLSIVDSEGNAVSLTSSIERAFGSRIWVRGFFLNNQLTDFSFNKEIQGKLIANRVEGGKRPRSSMAPTFVLDKESQLVLVTGSPGGSRIISYVSLALVASLDWKMNPQAAASLPHHTNRNGPTELEARTTLTKLESSLATLGHSVIIRPLVSGIHTIHISENGLIGGADPRREGVVKGF